MVTNQASAATLVATGSQTGTAGGSRACVARTHKHAQRQRRKAKTDVATDLLKVL